MRQEDKDMDKPDVFSREVGRKLREHRIPVDPGVWESLAEKFPPPARRIPLHRPWVAAGVAAVAAVLLLLTYPPGNRPVTVVAEQDTTKSAGPRPATPAQEYAGDPVGEPSGQPLTARHAESRKRAKQAATVPGSLPDGIEDVADSGEDMEFDNAATEKDSEPLVIPELPQMAEATGATTPEEIPDAGTEAFGENDFSLPARGRRQQGSLIAALGSGGGLGDLSSGYYDSDNPIYSGPPPVGGNNGGDGLGPDGKYPLLAPGDYTDIVHHPPVSVSLTAGFPVGGNVSVETGLSYTYLFSRMRRNDVHVYRGALRQHYVGIPVNLRYTAWRNDNWEIYLMGGGSIEKGIRSVYRQEIEDGGNVYRRSVRGRIGGFQFSAQGGAGFGYRLRDNLYLFGEPRIVYYFKNNQPMSARTEDPLIFGLNVGIRLQFK